MQWMQFKEDVSTDARVMVKGKPEAGCFNFK